MACLSAVQALCNLCNLIGQVLALHRLDDAIKSTFGHHSTVAGFGPAFLQNFTHSSNHAPSLIINSGTGAVGDDHAWETLLASGAIRHIHRRSPRRVCCTWSTQATLRGLALYVSCGTFFPLLCNQASRHVDYLLLTTCSATMFAMYLLSDPNGPPTAFLLCRPQCAVGVLAGTHRGALRCPSRMASGTRRQPLSAALLHCCCTAEPALTRATKHTPSVKHTCRGFW